LIGSLNSFLTGRKGNEYHPKAIIQEPVIITAGQRRE